MQSYVDFTREKEYFVNSNGVDFVTHKGVYHCVIMFSSRRETRFPRSITGVFLRDLEKQLLDCGSIDTLLRQSVEQIHARPLEGKFVGDVIITPQSINDVLYFIEAQFLTVPS